MPKFLSTFWDKFQNDPVFMRQLNGWLAVIWLAASLPICFFLSTSVPFLVFVSVYAIVTGHWSTWQGSRIEVKQQEESVAADILDELDKNTDVVVKRRHQRKRTMNTEDVLTRTKQ
jgi:hypothetical protein